MSLRETLTQTQRCHSLGHSGDDDFPFPTPRSVYMSLGWRGNYNGQLTSKSMKLGGFLSLGCAAAKSW